MILVIDTVRHAGEHMQINEAIVKSLIAHDDNVFFLTSLDYWESFPESLRKRMVFQNTDFLNSGFLGSFKSVFLFLKIVILRRDLDNIIFLSSITYNTFFVSLFSRTKVIKPRIFVFLHEVSYIDVKSSSARFAAFFLKLALKIGLSNQSKFLITGKYIGYELKRRFNFHKESTIFIEHPTSQKSYNSILPSPELIRFAALGVQCNEKNSYKIEEIAESNSDLIENSQLEISTIGRVEYKYNPEILVNHIGLKYDDYLIPSAEFERLILEQHYLLFFIGKEYDLKTSGVLFDAIKFQKPILAIRCNLVSFYFNKFGDIGHLYNDMNEMKEGVRNIRSSFNLERYKKQVDNLSIAKEKTSQEHFDVEIHQLLA